MSDVTFGLEDIIRTLQAINDAVNHVTLRMYCIDSEGISFTFIGGQLPALTIHPIE